MTSRRVVTGPLNRMCLPEQSNVRLNVFRVTFSVRVVTLTCLLLSADTVTPKFLFLPFNRPLPGIPMLPKTSLVAEEE